MKIRIVVISGIALAAIAGGMVYFLHMRGPSADDIASAKTMVEDAEELFAASRYSAAVEKYQEAQVTDGGNTDVYAGLAEIYVLKHRYADAIGVLTVGAEQSGNPSVLLTALGVIEYDQQNFDEATDYFQKALDANSENDEARYRLAQSYIQKDEPSSAEDVLEIPERDNGWVTKMGILKAMLLGDDIESAVGVLDGLPDAEDAGIGAYREVLERYSQAKEKVASAMYLDVILAQGALSAGYENSAISLLEPHVEDDVEYWEAYYYLGYAYHLDGDNEQASDMLATAEILKPGDAYASWLHARVYAALDDDDEMGKAYVRAISLASSVDKIAIRNEFVRELIDREQYAAAADQLTALEQEDPDNVQQYELMAASNFIAQKQYEEASAVLEELDPVTEEAWRAEYLWARAAVDFATASLDDALGWADSAVDLDDTQAKYHLLLGKIYFEQEENTLAKEELERAIDLDLAGDISDEAQKVLDRI